MNIIETPRLQLRELVAEDAASILDAATDSAINRHLGFGSIANELGVNNYIRESIAAAQTKPRSSFKLAMTLKTDSAPSPFAGSCWLDIEDFNSEHASIGYFVEHGHWGNGYASEMIAGLIRFGFEQLNLHRIFANCDAENLASQKVLEKVEFKNEGTLRQHYKRSHGWVDVCMFGLLKAEWTGPNFV